MGTDSGDGNDGYRPTGTGGYLIGTAQLMVETPGYEQCATHACCEREKRDENGLISVNEGKIHPQPEKE